MGDHTTKQRVLFEGLSKKGVTVQFDQDHASSDGGAILLEACDERLRLSETLAGCLSDDRDPSKVAHSLRELFRQRLLKLGAWIETSVGRIVIHLPVGTPFADDWRRIARSIGAVAT